MRQVNNAVTALYVSRDQRALIRLWGSFDRARAGTISTDDFDRAMLLFSDALSMEAYEDLGPRVQGHVKMWNPDKGYGFIKPRDTTEGDCFAHARDIRVNPQDGEPPVLSSGMNVEFYIDRNARNKNVTFGPRVRRLSSPQSPPRTRRSAGFLSS